MNDDEEENGMSSLDENKYDIVQEDTAIFQENETE